MADNFDFTPGTGSTGAADDIDGILYPRVKLIHGANNTNDGDVSSANPLPVTATVGAGATVYQGTQPWQSLGTVTIASCPTINAVVNTSLVTVDLGSAVLDTGENWIGLATVNTANTARTISANVTVNQGTTPWLSLGTATLAGSLPAGVNNIGFATITPSTTTRSLIGNVTVSMPGGVTVYQGTSIWNSLGTMTLASSPTLYAIVNTGAANSNVTLNPSVNWIGFATVALGSSATINAVVNTASSGNVTVMQGSTPWNSLGTATLSNGVGNIGFATITPSTTTRSITGNVTVSMPGGVTVYQGTAVWNSLGTVTLGAAGATIYAIVNTGAAGVQNSIVTVANPITLGANVTASIPSGVTVFQGTGIWNSLGTVTLASSPTLYAVVNTGAAGVQNSMVTIYPRTDFIGLVSVSGNVVNSAGVNWIGFATITPITTVRTISANVTVQQGTTPWLSLGTVTLASGIGNIGFATVTPSTTTRSLVGNVTISAPGGVTVYQGTAPWNAMVSVFGGKISLAPTTAGGCSIFRSIDLDETEEDVHGAAGQIYGYFLSNTNATVTRYVKFYNTTAANTSVGVNTPIMTVPLAALQGANAEFSMGIPFTTALCVAATTGVADSDVGAPATNDVIANVFYR